MNRVQLYGPEAMMCLGGGGGGTVGGSSHYGAPRRPTAPSLLGVSTFTDTDGSADELTPTIVGGVPGAIALAVVTRVGGSATITMPGDWTEFGNEGISTGEDAEMSLFWSRLELGFDTTPLVQDDTGGGSDFPWSVVISTWGDCIQTGEPFDTHGGANGTGSTATAPSLAISGLARTAFWTFVVEGSASLTTFSVGNNTYSGSSYGASTGGNLRAVAGRHFRDLDGPTSGTCTAQPGANNWAAYTVILRPQPV